MKWFSLLLVAVSAASAIKPRPSPKDVEQRDIQLVAAVPVCREAERFSACWLVSRKHGLSLRRRRNARELVAQLMAANYGGFVAVTPPCSKESPFALKNPPSTVS
ncbi:hypothetical protein BDR26DRAFT_939551 [Obelidium mucronatum]|nr:hypothetical protein BDR26DRAFT_939551 [Obelidium mucronatum]